MTKFALLRYIQRVTTVESAPLSCYADACFSDSGGRWRRKSLEESPDSSEQECRVTPGEGNLKESATENIPPTPIGFRKG